MLIAQPASAVECNLRNPSNAPTVTAVACIEDAKENAPEAFDRFGYANETLLRDYVQTTLDQNGCFVVIDQHKGILKMKRIGYVPVATMGGWRKVIALQIVSSSGGRAGFMDERYLTCQANPLPPNSQ